MSTSTAQRRQSPAAQRAASGKLERRRLFPLSAVFVLALLAVPLSAGGEEEQSIAVLRRMGKAFASIAEKASPAVVGVRAMRLVPADAYARQYEEGSDPAGPDWYDYFFRRPTPRRYSSPEPPEKEVAQGSGFLVAADGFILTNNHLVGEAQEITVQLGDGRKLTAKIVGTDPETDVAVIRVPGENLPFVELADSDALQVGEWVVAIGNPFGLSHTVTAWIVSAKGRCRMGVADYEDFIQTDAAINFGNSGGPLLNLDGKAVGINTAITGPGGNVGIGLAIPISLARVVYEQLKENGKVERGFLGVEIDNLEAGMGEFFGARNTRGAIVLKVLAGSAAAKAGVKADDIVVELEGEPVATANELMNRIALRKPGSSVHLAVLREGKRVELEITLDRRPPQEQEAEVAVGAVHAKDVLGLSVQTLTRETAEQLGYEGLAGVLIADVEPDSPAEENGLEPEMLIVEVNREAVRSVKQYHQALAKAKQKGKVLLRIRCEDRTALVLITLPQG